MTRPLSTVDEVEPDTADAFGATLAACWAAGGAANQAFEVVERDDGLISVCDASFYFSAPRDWIEPERWACDNARGRVLDVGCGAGRHAVVLMSAGHEVVGIDTSPAAVSTARDRGVDARHRSILEADDLGPFDTILMLGYNLGLLANRETSARILATLAALSTPDALFFGGGLNPWCTTAPEHFAYYRRNQEAGRLAGEQRIRIRHRATATPWFPYLNLSPQELEELLTPSPWRLVEYRRTSGASYVAQMCKR